MRPCRKRDMQSGRCMMHPERRTQDPGRANEIKPLRFDGTSSAHSERFTLLQRKGVEQPLPSVDGGTNSDSKESRPAVLTCSSHLPPLEGRLNGAGDRSGFQMHTGGEREDQSKAKNGLRIGRLRVVSASTAIQELSWALDQGSRFVTGCHAASLDTGRGAEADVDQGGRRAIVDSCPQSLGMTRRGKGTTAMDLLGKSKRKSRALLQPSCLDRPSLVWGHRAAQGCSQR
jgi:hypothetical protein